MNKTLIYLFLSICFLSSLEVTAAPSDSAPPPEVIARLVTNASQKPPGPVENDIAEQVVSRASVFLKQTKDSRSLREDLAEDYNFFSIEVPPVQIYSNGPAAIFEARIKLNDDFLHGPNKIPTNLSEDSGPDFGDSLGGWMYLNVKVKEDGHVVATFCLVQQHGAWKVHNFYISNTPLNDKDKKFIVTQLDLFAKKQ
jgi:hypothetical protein